jgi:RNA polymerase sigma factor (TIGR02999 family)
MGADLSPGARSHKNLATAGKRMAHRVERAWHWQQFPEAGHTGCPHQFPQVARMPNPDAGTEGGPATRLLLAFTGGDRKALDEMLPLVYDELHRLAEHYLSTERENHTLQPTALVHEAYMRLINQRAVDWRNRAQFMGVAAGIMRRILINHARDRAASKRGGDHREQISLSLVEASAVSSEVELTDLDDALQRLTDMDARKARVVELKFFGGLTMDEIAEVVGISRATVEREWSFARAWLFNALGGAAS